MKLLFLGTGAADGVVGKPMGEKFYRRCSSALVDRDLLLDPGPHIFDFAEQYGDTDLYAGVTDILCTHSHPDHFSPDTVRALLDKNPALTLWGDEAIRRKLTRLAPDVMERIRFVPLTHGGWADIGGYRVLSVHSNHSTGDPEEVTLHHIIEKDGRRLFYGLDGAWILRESWNIMRELEGPYHAMVFDTTCGESLDEFRVFEHNTIPMLEVMIPGMKCKRFHVIGEETKLYAHHLARSLHDPDYDVISKRLAPLGMTVVYDGLEIDV